MSKLKIPGPMMLFRTALPWVNCGCSVNAAVLNHWSMVFGPSFGSWPLTASGRLVLPVLARSCPAAGSRGKPLERLMMLVNCQPPRIAAPTPD